MTFSVADTLAWSPWMILQFNSDLKFKSLPPLDTEIGSDLQVTFRIQSGIDVSTDSNFERIKIVRYFHMP